MNNSEIVVFTPVYKNLDVIVDQIFNYKKFFGNNTINILHLSLESDTSLKNNILEKVGEEARLIFCDSSWGTSYRGVCGAFMGCTEKLLKLQISSIKYVYLHSDADLLIKGDVIKYIKNHKIAYDITPLNDQWHFGIKARKDQRFSELLKYLKIPKEQIIMGRADGTFFPIDIWLEATEIILKFWDKNFFANTTDIWPIEECVLATVVNFLHKEIQPARRIIRTKEFIHKEGEHSDYRADERNSVTIEEVQSILDDNTLECTGIKWFSPNMQNPARTLIRNIKL